MSESSDPPLPAPESIARTYLVWSLAATVLCFLPVGLVAVYFGLRVNRANAEGRTQDANRSSRVARRWLVATAVIGIAIYALVASVLALLGAFST